ncbi:MAG TPA: TSUP family transporter, partial [Vicinamibacterales bacterium]
MAALPIMDASSWILGVAALVAGSIASIAGFGIGSVLTPTLSLWIDAKLAVAAISIPHLIGTAVRFWLLKGRVDRRVLWSFGIASAAGGVAGALLNAVFTSPVLLTLLAV